MGDFDGLVACLCEGNTERAIIDILFEKDLLIFKELLDDKPLNIRSAKEFEDKYLRKGFDGQITIVRVLDSRKENFRLSALYKDKVKVINIITSPEIEMLIIHAENKYDDFKSRKMKPSIYCKAILKLKNVKSYDFIREHFSDVNKLVGAIRLHRKKSDIKKGEKCLFDIIKP